MLSFHESLGSWIQEFAMFRKRIPRPQIDPADCQQQKQQQRRYRQGRVAHRRRRRRWWWWWAGPATGGTFRGPARRWRRGCPCAPRCSCADWPAIRATGRPTTTPTSTPDWTASSRRRRRSVASSRRPRPLRPASISAMNGASLGSLARSTIEPRGKRGDAINAI